MLHQPCSNYSRLKKRPSPSAIIAGLVPVPSLCPACSCRYLLNPLTVNRALQALGDEGLLETRRGQGFFVRPGALAQLKQAERQHFLADEWPLLRTRLRRLGLAAVDLNWE